MLENSTQVVNKNAVPSIREFLSALLQNFYYEKCSFKYEPQEFRLLKCECKNFCVERQENVSFILDYYRYDRQALHDFIKFIYELEKITLTSDKIYYHYVEVALFWAYQLYIYSPEDSLSVLNYLEAQKIYGDIYCDFSVLCQAFSLGSKWIKAGIVSQFDEKLWNLTALICYLLGRESHGTTKLKYFQLSESYFGHLRIYSSDENYQEWSDYLNNLLLDSGELN
eukprot:NODE_84_length_22354_cov_0.646506.p12 type:complete len:225 gc:universal NODE_84_length_22354_cov_0.646506:885-1559(+)